MLAKDFRRLDLRAARVILIEGGPRLLGAYPPALSDKAQAQLESLGVAVWLGSPVKEIRAGEVALANGTIRAGNIIWAAGISASALTAQLGAEIDRAGRVKVLPDLSLPGHPEVRVLGDLVALTDPKGQVVPGVAPAAMQMGAYAAAGIAEELQAAERSGAAGGRSTDPARRAPFVYRDKGNMATIGRSRAIAKVGRLEFSGFPAWVAWLSVHLLFLVGFRNKLSVLLSWSYSYLTFKRGARVIYGGGPSTSDTDAKP